MPLHDLQPAQLPEQPLVEINKLAATDYEELNFTFLQISNVKNVKVNFPLIIFLTQKWTYFVASTGNKSTDFHSSNISFLNILNYQTHYLPEMQFLPPLQ